MEKNSELDSGNTNDLTADAAHLVREHEKLTRRYFMGLAAAGLAGVGLAAPAAEPAESSPALAEAIAKLQYLTRDEDFTFFGRVTPKPYDLSPEQLRAAGLTQETWRLEVLPDPQSNAVMENPLSRERGTAFTWQDLMALAQTHAVRLLNVMTCTNTKKPCGMGLWEGVPLREVIWRARPQENVRRVFYDGFHHNDPAQLFQSSLPIGRVLEDPPGEHPVLLCYKLNQQWLSLRAGGPVRMLVPGEYGNKSIKWLQRVYLTNDYRANDTYALKNNDTVSALKTCARFIHAPQKVKRGEPIPITGLAQAGMSGLKAVQVWLAPQGQELPADDPYFTRAPWQEAALLAPPREWGGGLPGGKITELPVQFDPKTGKPAQWPIRYTIAHWAALLRGMAPGNYDLRCRTIDANGAAQPMPRPFAKSGNNAIEKVAITIEA